MRVLVILFITALIAGCAWTPERSNPFDPSSNLYVPPPISNRPPAITGFVINTSCLNSSTEDQCGVTLRARISDPDSNLRIGDVVASVDGRYFGRLAYYPVDTLWALTLQESELDSAAEKFAGSLVMLSVSDDSGATDEDTLRFPSPFKAYPEIHWPRTTFHCICPDYRNFSWTRWTGGGHASELELRFYFSSLEYVPSLTLSGIAPSDTTVEVIRNFVPADSNGTIFYGWRVFVYDQLGNSAGSLPGAFRYVENCSPACVPD